MPDEFRGETGATGFDRRLVAAVSYPTGYGFVVGPHAPDGDELDTVARVAEPTFPGCGIRARRSLPSRPGGPRPGARLLGRGVVVTAAGRGAPTRRREAP